MTSISDFCYQHGACREGREWAIDNCTDMADAWQKLQHDWLLWVATRPGVLTDRDLRLFSVFCARQVEHLLTDQRSRDAIDTAERFAKGEVTCEDLASAAAAAAAAARDGAWHAARDASRDAARAAAWDAARHAAWAAVRAAARDASRDAARAAAWDAAAARDAFRDAAWHAAWDAARHAAWAAAWDSAWAAQAEWLRDNTRPNFGAEWNPTTRGGHHVRNVVRDATGWRGEVCLRLGGPRRGEPEDWHVEVWHSDGTYYGGSPKSELDLVAITEGEGQS